MDTRRASTQAHSAVRDNVPDPGGQRRVLGVASLLLLATSLALYVGGPLQGGWMLFAAACTRVGFMCGAVWLAWPQLLFFRHAPPWAWGLLLIAGVVLMYRPKLLAVVAPLLLALAALHWLGRFGRR